MTAAFHYVTTATRCIPVFSTTQTPLGAEHMMKTWCRDAEATATLCSKNDPVITAEAAMYKPTAALCNAGRTYTEKAFWSASQPGR